MTTAIKTIGSNGQISLGKQFAGRQVLVEEQEPGVWLVRTATLIPDNERIWHTPEAQAALQASLQWATKNPVSTQETDDVMARLAQANLPSS